MENVVAFNNEVSYCFFSNCKILNIHYIKMEKRNSIAEKKKEM